MKTKKCVLILGSLNEAVEKNLRASMSVELEKQNACVFFVQAKDGFDASLKAENQKFDAVIVDTEVPRLFEGGFVHNISLHKNTCESEIFVVSLQPRESLPASLQSGQFLAKPLCEETLIAGLIRAVLKTIPAGNAEAQKFNVDVRIINAVIKATLHVCKQYGLTDVQMLKPESRDTQGALSGDVASLMPIKSQSFNGSMIVSFDRHSYLTMVGTMLGEEQFEINADNMDAIGEINNIIFGNAKPDFTQYGVEMSTPKILRMDQAIHSPPGSARMLIPFSVGKAQFFIEVIAHPK